MIVVSLPALVVNAESINENKRKGKEMKQGEPFEVIITLLNQQVGYNEHCNIFSINLN